MARRYGARPSAILGIDPGAGEDRRILAYHVDRAAAHAGVWQETAIYREVTAGKPTTTTTAPRPTAPATFSAKHGIRGKVRFSDEPIPAWLEALFPEGPIQKPPTA